MPPLYGYRLLRLLFKILTIKITWNSVSEYQVTTPTLSDKTFHAAQAAFRYLTLESVSQCGKVIFKNNSKSLFYMFFPIIIGSAYFLRFLFLTKCKITKNLLTNKFFHFFNRPLRA
ncbi:MAG: hypothetical protein LBN95_06295 [Prevotellaceae bacterium]|nr:hypothetical protein [Prevotellaceae bacterium]